MIKSLDHLVEKVTQKGDKKRIAVTWAQDENSLGALARAVEAGFAEAILVGKREAIISVCKSLSINHEIFEIIDSTGEVEAASLTVDMVRTGRADILMKGLVGTDKFLKAIMNKEKGLITPGAVLTYGCAVQLPAYPKLLFLTDPAVLPFPDLDQKIAMANYSIAMARKFGIDKPKIALIGASEKMSKHFQNSVDYAIMCKMADRGQIRDCVMDGPLDIFLACDPESVRIKGVETAINGEADILLFPSIESCNPFYKGIMLFGGGELAGMLMGTTHPVVLMSRSETENSKFYCIALSCLMADNG